MTSSRAFGILIALLLLLGLPATDVSGQFSDTGTLRVQVNEPTGEPIAGASLVISGEGVAADRTLTTGSNGDAVAGFLPGGTYQIRVERLGFVPLEAVGLRVDSGRRKTIQLELRRGTPPITETDRQILPGAPDVMGIPAWGAGPSRSRPAAIPGTTPGTGPQGSLPQVALPTSAGYPGLPASFFRIELDDLRQIHAAPGGAGGGWDRLLLPNREALGRWGLTSGGFSHASSGSGNLLRLTSVRPGTELRGGVRLAGSRTDRTDGTGRDPSSITGGHLSAWVEGPVSGDSIRASGTISVGRSALLSAGPGLAPADAHDLLQQDWLAGSGTLAWDIGSTTTLTSRLHLAHLPENPDTGPSLLALADPPPASGTDLATSIHLLTRGESGSALEMRAGIQRSSRTSGVDALTTGSPLDASVSSGAFMGAGLASTGSETRTRISLSPAGRLIRGPHLLEAGLAIGIHGFESQRGPPGLQALTTGSSSGSLSRHGTSLTLLNPLLDVDFSWQEIGIFGQYSWYPMPNLSLSVEARADVVSLPEDGLPTAEDWYDRTSTIPPELESGAPRGSGAVGVRWEVPALPGWEIEARSEVIRDMVDPYFFEELLRWGGPDQGVARAITEVRTDGTLGPTVSQSSGQRRILPGPNFERPDGSQSSLAMAIPLGSRLRLDLSARRMETTRMLRARDLNRTPGPGQIDPFGRMIHGEVVEVGGLITIEPGSDRRFPELDQVLVLETDGMVESRAVTASLSMALDQVELGFLYRNSDTQDNAPFGPRGRPAPFSAALDGDFGDADWRSGRSDLDVPHLFQASGQVRLPIAGGVSLGLNHVTHSNRPFTPGVRDALHGLAWEEGWQRLAPIRIPEGVDLGGIPAEWRSCLGSPGGARLERNSCRNGLVHILDLRLVAGLPGPAGRPIYLTFDARNLLDRGVTLHDGAVFVVEPGAPLREGGADTDLALPARLNTEFGRTIADLSPGRSFHFGLELRF